jgi:hypothetical protein
VVKLQSPEPSAVTVPIDTPPSYIVMVALASAVPVNVGVLSFVRLSVEDEPLSDAALKSGAEGAVGAVASMVILKPVEAEETLPAPSVALAVRVWVPALKVLLVMPNCRCHRRSPCLVP